jgi:hypothetical protein
MKKWIVKVIIQKTISYAPYSNRINYLFQKYVTKSIFLSDDLFWDRLGHARDHLISFSKFSTKAVPGSTLEMGTGWYPIVPIAFFLAGVDKIYSVDISFLTSPERIKTVLRKFVEINESGLLSSFIACIPDRMAQLRNLLLEIDNLSMNEVLSKLHISYLIEDARKLSLPDDSIDFINSNNTFEHISPDILIPIMEQLKRVVNKTSGVMSHFIDLSDHYSHFDSSISPYNFLKFSEKQWRWINNPLQYQNRLRVYDYKKINNDLEIGIAEETLDSGSLSELRSVKLADKFRNHPECETAVVRCHFISIPNSK